MKILNFAIAGLCFLFAGFQYNDPDPTLWIVIYGAVGILAVLAGLGRHCLPAVAFVAAVCIYLLGTCQDGLMEFMTNDDGQTIANPMSDDQPYVEVFREFGGLVIALTFLSVIAWTGGCCRKKKPIKIG